MKMNIRGWLLAPWVVLFTVVIASIVVAGSKYHIDLRTTKYSIVALIIGILICAYFNFKTITRAGIWISYSVPKNLKPSSWQWLMRVLFAVFVAISFYNIGQISWVPLYWQGFILPIALSLSLLFIITSILSPILIWCANLPFTRFAALMGSSPVLIVLPLSGIFMGDMILRSYEASLPKPLLMKYKVSLDSTDSTDKEKSEKDLKSLHSKNVDARSEASLNNLLDPKSERAKRFKVLALSNSSCADEAVSIQSALHERNPDDVVYWATRAVGCANLRPMSAMTKLVDIMLKHGNSEVRASAIRAMSKFKTEIVQNVGYLLVKQINERHPPEIIEAASYVYSRLGGTEYNITMRKLKLLLIHPTLSRPIADIMVRVMNREDLIFEYIVTSLNESSESNERTPIKMSAVAMVCSLPKKSLDLLVPHVSSILALVDKGDRNDPAKMALDCMGNSGINAIREEIKTPKILPRVAAARVLSQMDIRNSKEALDTVSSCVYDSDEEMRKICSTSLGKVGVAALPKIIELMSASKDEYKKYGEQALNSLEDPSAKQDLLAIRARNSGWLATQKKLHLVRSIDTTLVRIEGIQSDLLMRKRAESEKQIVPVKKSVTKANEAKTTL
jgi:HEAT repeat protein